jgi:hypothetical protein
VYHIFCNTILVISSVLNQRENEENVLTKLMIMKLTHNQLTYRTNVTYAIWILCQWHQIYLTHVLRTRPSSVGTFIVKGATICVTIAIRLLWFGGCFLITCSNVCYIYKIMFIMHQCSMWINLTSLNVNKICATFFFNYVKFEAWKSKNLMCIFSFFLFQMKQIIKTWSWSSLKYIFNKIDI